MRRLLAIGATVAVAAFAAACGSNDDDGGEPAPQPTDNTAQVCANAQMVQAQQAQQLDQDIAELREQDLDEEEFTQGALGSMEQALVGWSDGLHQQAEVAENPELTDALTGLADGLAEAAPQLTEESLETGQIPGAEELDVYGFLLDQICQPAPPATD